jgi:hypothetical protein
MHVSRRHGGSGRLELRASPSASGSRACGAFRTLGIAMGALGASGLVHTHFVARGRDVVFPENTTMEIEQSTKTRTSSRLDSETSQQLSATQAQLTENDDTVEVPEVLLNVGEPPRTRTWNPLIKRPSKDN